MAKSTCCRDKRPVGRDRKEVQKDYEKSVWMGKKIWLWLKEGGKIDITVFIKWNEICMVTPRDSHRLLTILTF